MARELKGYARKAKQGLVPYQYDRAKQRGVGPLSYAERTRYSMDALRRAQERNAFVAPVQRRPLGALAPAEPYRAPTGYTPPMERKRKVQKFHEEARYHVSR